MASIAPDGRVVCNACGESSPPESKFCGGCGEPLDPGLPMPGDVIAGRYRIVGPIGRGAMGTVYRAEHVSIGKVVAIKLLHKDLQQSPENVARFHLEAESASRLNHPNTVHVFDFGTTESGSLYIVMEYVDGDDLGKLIDKGGPMPFGRVAYICAQVAGSVADAHEAGIVHRDLKPENVVVTRGRDGEMAKVLDFGLAKLFAVTPEQQVTGAGTIVGTPYYMSPEQVQGSELDGRSDVYAIGAIMYECVVGKPPFEAPNPVGVLSKHLTQQALAPSSRSPMSLPPEADEIIMRCLEKDREDRYSSAEALRLRIIEYLASIGEENWRMSGLGTRSIGSGTRRVDSLFTRKRPRWLAFALLSIVVFGAGIWRYATSGPTEREPNDAQRDATRLLPDEEMEAFLGQRIDEGTGDVDLFGIEHRAAERGTATLSLSEIPNMDVTLELLREGEAEPFVIADSGKVGEGEHLPNVPLEPGKYFIRVREKTVEGGLPTENVSDPYYVRWELPHADANFETEPNDSLELAEPVPLGEERRAWLGWAGDVDTFCLSEEAGRVVAQVSALAGVDLVLRIVDRHAERSGKHNDNGVGRGETTKPWRNAKGDGLCVEVSANPMGEGVSAQPAETYGVRFITAPAR